MLGVCGGGVGTKLVRQSRPWPQELRADGGKLMGLSWGLRSGQGGRPWLELLGLPLAPTLSMASQSPIWLVLSYRSGNRDQIVTSSLGLRL